MQARRPTSTDSDELDRYLLEPVLDQVDDIISWWRGQKTRLPNLTAMTLDIFAIPAMSAEPERVFSGAKHTLDNRAVMSAATVEITECLKSFFRTGILTQEDLTKAIAEEVEGA